MTTVSAGVGNIDGVGQGMLAGHVTVRKRIFTCTTVYENAMSPSKFGKTHLVNGIGEDKWAINPEKTVISSIDIPPPSINKWRSREGP